MVLSAVLLLCAAAAEPPSPLLIDAPGSVRVGGELWLQAAAPRLFCNGSWHGLLEDGAAPAAQPAAQPLLHANSSDALGAFTAVARRLVAADDSTIAATLTVKDYGDGVFVLDQSLPAGCRAIHASVPRMANVSAEDFDTANPGRVPPFLSFPAWEVDAGKLRQLPYLTWQGADHSTYQWTVQESHGVDITTPKTDGTFSGLAVRSPPSSPHASPRCSWGLILAHVCGAAGSLLRAGGPHGAGR